MTGFSHRDLVAGALRCALPYIRLFRGRTFVVKVGGALCANAGGLRELMEQVSLLAALGIRVVVVHGGGPQTSALARELGLEPAFVAGRRVTCPRTLELAVMTINGTVSTALRAACRAVGLPALGLSGVDAGLLVATRRPPRVVDGVSVDYGLVGDLEAVDPTALTALLAAGFTPLVSPLAADAAGQVLNVNADSAAARIAVALGAEKLIFLVDTPGLLEDAQDAGTLVSFTDARGIARLKERGSIHGGMLPKVEAALVALAGGVGRVHLVGAGVPSSLLVELFTNEGAGTLIVRDTAELPAAELPAAEAAAAAEGAAEARR